MLDAVGGPDLNVGFFVHHVGRDGDEDGASCRLGGVLEGAAQQDGHLGGVSGLRGPLGDRLGQADEIARQDRLLRRATLLVLAGVDDQRRAGAVGVVEHAHRVAEAGHDVQLQERGPSRGARVAVRDAGGDGLLQRQDVLELRVVLEGVDERLLGGAGVAEDVLRPLGEELFDHGVAAAETGHGGLLRRTR